MKNLSRRDFLRLSGATVLAVGMTGALSGCDSSHVNTVTVQTVELNEEVKTAYGNIRFTSYEFNRSSNNEYLITCSIEVMAAEGHTLELDNTNFWMELDGNRPDDVCLSAVGGYDYGGKIRVSSTPVPITATTTVTGSVVPQQLVGRFEYKGIRIKTKPQGLQQG